MSVSVSLLHTDIAVMSHGVVLPVHESLSTKDHGEELGWILCASVSVLQPLLHHVYIHTKSAARHRALLAIFVVCCSQLVVAEYLVRLANLSPRQPRNPGGVSNRIAISSTHE
ncbi:hypothetical protein IG631_05961 [Alternaria alternata]|nr:hypothetical protein IG631_05961 [Alternaria alternata]